MSWLSDLFHGDHPTNPYSAAQIYQFQIQAQQDLKNADPAAWEKRYGKLSPAEVVANGLQFGSAEGQPDANDPSGFAPNTKWTPEQISLVENSRTAGSTNPDVPDQPPPPPPDTPPDTPPDQGPPPYQGPSARQKLDALLPGGFESSLVNTSMTDPFVESAFQRERKGAQDFIGNALRRGTLTESGGASALSKLGEQDTGVRGRLQSLADTLLENERGKLRGIVNPGRDLANTSSGEFFDPTPYKQSVDQELASFTSGLGGAYGDVTPKGPLYDTNALLSGGGGVTGPQNLSYDPYAVEGGQLKTGIEDDTQDTTAARKKPTTAVF